MVFIGNKPRRHEDGKKTQSICFTQRRQERKGKKESGDWIQDSGKKVSELSVSGIKICFMNLGICNDNYRYCGIINSIKFLKK